MSEILSQDNFLDNKKKILIKNGLQKYRESMQYVRKRYNMKLDEYLFRNKTKQVDFADKVGISRVHIGHIVRGTKKPSTKLAKAIELATEGKVTKEELLFPEEYENKDV